MKQEKQLTLTLKVKEKKIQPQSIKNTCLVFMLRKTFVSKAIDHLLHQEVWAWWHQCLSYCLNKLWPVKTSITIYAKGGDVKRA